jgi:prepilin-type N-terminal cleavage/methylation domain-containing protein
MWKDSRGFTLAESMVSLLVLLIALRFLIPIMTQIEFETHVMAEHEAALTILHNSLIDWSKRDRTLDSLHYLGTSYTLDWVRTDQVATLCVEWTISTHRSGKECGELKR